MVYGNVWLESINTIFTAIRRIIFYNNMHNHQKSQIDRKSKVEEELSTMSLTTHELFLALSKL